MLGDIDRILLSWFGGFGGRRLLLSNGSAKSGAWLVLLLAERVYIKTRTTFNSLLNLHLPPVLHLGLFVRDFWRFEHNKETRIRLKSASESDDWINERQSKSGKTEDDGKCGSSADRNVTRFEDKRHIKEIRGRQMCEEEPSEAVRPQ